MISLKMKKISNYYIATVLIFFVAAESTFAKESITYFHSDLSGSPLFTTNEEGGVKWKEQYTAFGQRHSGDQLSGNENTAFTGYPEDSDSGLSYARARWYDPVIGRFTGIDPVGVSPYNIHSFNRYSYANNNPYTFIDPDGRTAQFNYQIWVLDQRSCGACLPITNENTIGYPSMRAVPKEPSGIYRNVGSLSSIFSGAVTIGKKFGSLGVNDQGLYNFSIGPLSGTSDFEYESSLSLGYNFGKFGSASLNYDDKGFSANGTIDLSLDYRGSEISFAGGVETDSYFPLLVVDPIDLNSYSSPPPEILDIETPWDQMFIE